MTCDLRDLISLQQAHLSFPLRTMSSNPPAIERTRSSSFTSLTNSNLSLRNQLINRCELNRTANLQSKTLIHYLVKFRAKVAELADAPDLGSGTVRCGGSSPPFRTTAKTTSTLKTTSERQNPILNITVTDQQQCKKQFRLEIPSETVRAETDKVAADLARKVSVPGFRPGHVPKSVIKTRFRKELRDEMLAQLLPHSLGDAIKKKDLKVVGEPSVEDLKFGDDESIDVTFNVEVAPEFTLSNYRELPLTKRNYKVRDEDIDKAIDRVRQGQAQLVPVEDRTSQTGDIVTVNLLGTPQAEEGATETLEEIKQEDLELEIGSDGVFKEFTEGLTGVRPGDTREFSVDYPADYKPDKYAGKHVDYKAEVTAVRVKELPEADDVFAHGVNEDFKTIEDLRQDIRSKMETESTQRTDNEFRSATM